MAFEAKQIRRCIAKGLTQSLKKSCAVLFLHIISAVHSIFVFVLAFHKSCDVVGRDGSLHFTDMF